MQGSFSDEALSTYVQVLKDTLGVSFSEGSYDFVRCVKPNGDAYGTAGQCRKGVQEDKGSEESGSTSKGEGGGGGICRGAEWIYLSLKEKLSNGEKRQV
jgi:hypothetical protein